MSGTGSVPDGPGQRLEEILAEHRDPAAEHDEAPTHDPLDPFAPLVPPEDRAGDPAEGQPDDADQDEDPLPDAPLFALLRSVESEVGVDRIDRIWIFPPRKLEAGETAVLVVAVYPELDEARRRVYAAHYTAHSDEPAPRLALDEYGTAPTERVGRLVEEVVERIKDGPAGAPRSVRVEGQDGLWNTMLHELAEQYLDQARRSPRLRP